MTLVTESKGAAEAVHDPGSSQPAGGGGPNVVALGSSLCLSSVADSTSIALVAVTNPGFLAGATAAIAIVGGVSLIASVRRQAVGAWAAIGVVLISIGVAMGTVVVVKSMEPRTEPVKADVLLTDLVVPADNGCPDLTPNPRGQYVSIDRPADGDAVTAGLTAVTGQANLAEGMSLFMIFGRAGEDHFWLLGDGYVKRGDWGFTTAGLVAEERPAPYDGCLAVIAANPGQKLAMRELFKTDRSSSILPSGMFGLAIAITVRQP